MSKFSLASTSAIALAALIGAVVAAPVVAADPAPPRIAGVWWATKPVSRLLPADGEALPFTDAGRAQYAKNAAGLRNGSIVDEAVHTCLPEGMPRALTSAYPFQIVVTASQVTFVHEANAAFRTVALTDSHANPRNWDPSFMGEAIAHWEGGELVVDSTNFKADSIYLDASGIPASEHLHLIEHITLKDGGNELEDIVTVDDPVVFSKPWSARLVFRRRPDVQLHTDWVCGERHRDLAGAAAR